MRTRKGEREKGKREGVKLKSGRICHVIRTCLYF